MPGRRNIDLVPARSTIRMSRRFSLVIIENVLWHYRAVDEALQVPRQRRDMLHPLHDYLLLLPFALPRLTAGYRPLQTLQRRKSTELTPAKMRNTSFVLLLIESAFRVKTVGSLQRINGGALPRGCSVFSERKRCIIISALEHDPAGHRDAGQDVLTRIDIENQDTLPGDIPHGRPDDILNALRVKHAVIQIECQSRCGKLAAGAFVDLPYHAPTPRSSREI